MDEPVEKLKRMLGAATDMELAAKLGLERSTISQWRRRGKVPKRYADLVVFPTQIDPDRHVRVADRRRVYGDGPGRYILSAALAFIPPHHLDFGDNLSPEKLGWAREARIMSVVQVVLRVCMELFGKPRCDNEAEYLRLIEALEEEGPRVHIGLALLRGIVRDP